MNDLKTISVSWIDMFDSADWKQATLISGSALIGAFASRWVDKALNLQGIYALVGLLIVCVAIFLIYTIFQKISSN